MDLSTDHGWPVETRERRAAVGVLLTAVVLTGLCWGAAEAGQLREGGARVSPGVLPSSTPEAQGMDSERLADAVELLLQQREVYEVHSLTVLRHGHVVADVSFYPYRSSSLHNLASVSKAVLTTLVGIAIDQGLIESVNERVVDFFPDRRIENLDSWKRSMTLEHLLTMTSGLGTSDVIDTELMLRSPDWVQFALDLPMSSLPGTRWRYHQPTAFLLSAILTRATGMSALEFARINLLTPLEIERVHWSASPNGITYGYHELKLRPHDLARFGQLILQAGRWNDAQLVSESWVEAATRPVVAGVYGYMWYRHPELPECFVAAGSRGQRLVVVPAQDLVVVMTGGGSVEADIERVVVDVLRSHILRAVRSDSALPENPAGRASLAAVVEDAEAPGCERVSPAPLPEMASKVAGAVFEVQSNPLGIETLELDFPAHDEVRLRFTTDGTVTYDRRFPWAAGLDGVERCARGMLGALQCGTGGWRDARRLQLTVDLLGLLAHNRLDFEFSADGRDLRVLVQDLDWWEPTPPFVLHATARD